MVNFLSFDSNCKKVYCLANIFQQLVLFINGCNMQQAKKQLKIQLTQIQALANQLKFTYSCFIIFVSQHTFILKYFYVFINQKYLTYIPCKQR